MQRCTQTRLLEKSTSVTRPVHPKPWPRACLPLSPHLCLFSHTDTTRTQPGWWLVIAAQPASTRCTSRGARPDRCVQAIAGTGLKAASAAELAIPQEGGALARGRLHYDGDKAPRWWQRAIDIHTRDGREGVVEEEEPEGEGHVPDY